DSDSTSATRNDSSSSMTAISRCLATQHPCPQLTEEMGETKLCTRPGCPEIIQECYSLRRGDAGTVDRSEIGHRFRPNTRAYLFWIVPPGSTTKTVAASAITGNARLPRSKISRRAGENQTLALT